MRRQRRHRTNSRIGIERLETRRLLSQVIYVDAGASGAVRSGASWADAYHDLQQALAAADAGDEIRVADGIYKPASGADRNATFQLESGVALLGGFAGDGAADPDARDLARFHTILSGDIGAAGTYTDNSNHVVTAGSGVDATAVLDGFVVAHGETASTPNNGGAGLYNPGGSPTVRNCTFTANRAGRGGAIFNAGATAAPSIVDCTFAGNFAQGAGGGVANIAGAGAIITNCTFQRNYSYEGAGVNNAYDAGTIVITGCTFTENWCQSGGGIYANGGTTTVTRSTFLRNVSTYQGGGILAYGWATVLNVSYCTFYGNTSNSGGGVHLGTAAGSTVSHCAFVGNLGQNGAAGKIGGQETIVNSTFTANTTNGSFGGGIALDINGFTGQIVNSIIWGNPFGGFNQAPPAGHVTYTNTQNGTSGTGNINADPRFLRVPTAGQDSTWGTYDDNYGDLRMRGDSLAIDGGSNAAVPAGTTLDLAGAPRFVDKLGFGSPSTIVDMGAYESQTRAASVTAPHSAWGKTSLNVVGYSFTPGPLTYAWDLDSDGQFDDATLSSVVVSLDAYTAPTTLPIAVRLTDSQGVSVVAHTSVNVVMTVVYVDPRATGNGDGTSWANAVTDLETAMSRGIHNQEFRVAGGTYTPSAINDPTASFHLRSGVKVFGGYAGLGAANPDARDFAMHPTILSGDIGAAGIADNSLHVVQATYLWNFGSLDGLTIAGGNADNRMMGFSDEGGGMLVTAGKPTFRNVTFTRNLAQQGGALSNRLGATPTFTDCTFAGNTASGGGAIHNDMASPTLINCVFVGNRATWTAGAIYNTANSFPPPTPSRPIAINCTFTANFADSGGGAIYDYNGFTTLTNCIVWGNVAGNGSQITQFEGGTVVTFSDVQGGFTGSGNIDADPQFVRTPSPGGDATWGTTDDDYGDLRLQMTSPAVDSGNTAAVPVSVTTDRAGRPRVFDFPGVRDPGNIVDMGAHELGMTLGVLRVAAGQRFALPAGGRTFLIEQLDLGSGATLDVVDNTLVLDYSADGPSTIGAFNGVAYDGVTGLIQSAYNFSAWDGVGLTTSMSQAQVGITTLAVGEASEALFITGEQTALWHGVVVDATAVIVKYTYTGDLNFDGTIDGADYGTIDNYVQFPGTWGFANGDFNFDGVIDGADYGLIDNAVQFQDGPL